jgi:hypothetical protein
MSINIARESAVFSPRHLLSAAALAVLSMTGLASATPAAAFERVTATATAVALNASIPIKFLMAGLLLATVAAIVVATRNLLGGPINGGSAFLSGLRYGGPLVGLLGAALNGLWSFMAIAATDAPMPFSVYAPGLAEAMLVLVFGLVSGVVGVIAHWAVEARIDRVVLKA